MWRVPVPSQGSVKDEEVKAEVRECMGHRHVTLEQFRLRSHVHTPKEREVATHPSLKGIQEF